MGSEAGGGMSREAVRDLRRLVEERMAAFDVGLVTPADAAEMRRDFTVLKRRLEAAELACVRRVAQTKVVRTRADADGSKWAGRQLGVSNGQAAELLGLGDRLERFP